jgi:hypothetical protein
VDGGTSDKRLSLEFGDVLWDGKEAAETSVQVVRNADSGTVP